MRWTGQVEWAWEGKYTQKNLFKNLEGRKQFEYVSVVMGR
jgi:hypothetical protein